VTLGQAKTAAIALLKCLPPAQRQIVEQNLRPLDELDFGRIAAWHTAGGLRAAFDRANADEVRESASWTNEVLAEGNAPPPFVPTSAANLIAALSDSDDEGARPPPLVLGALADRNLTVSALCRFPPARADLWQVRVEQEATLVLAEVGLRPGLGDLAYIRCRFEARRQLLLQSRVRAEYESPGMVQVVRMAMKLSTEGSLPKPGEHGRTDEFIRRCAAALQVLQPGKETVLAKLDAEKQYQIRLALGGADIPYDGCMTCLDDETAWEVSDMLSRCARCKMPKSFGRTVNSVRDIIAPVMQPERGFRFLAGRY